MSESPPPPPSSPRTGRGVRIALFVSLALNLAVVGLVAGAALDHWREDRAGSGRDRSDVSRDLGLGPYLRGLSPEQRRALAQQVRAEHGTGDRPLGVRRELRRGFEQALGVLRTEPFDPEAFTGLLAAQSSSAEALRASAQAALVEALAAMTPAARIAYADALEATLRRGRPPRDR